MEYEIHPANGDKHIAEKVIDLGLSAFKFGSQGDFTLLKLFYLFFKDQRIQYSYAVGFFLRIFFVVSFLL